MIRKHVFWIFLLFSVFLLKPLNVYAAVDVFNPSKLVGDGINSWLNDIVSGLLSEAFKGLTIVLFNPTDLSQVPMLQAQLPNVQYICLALLGVRAVWSYLQIMYSNVDGNMTITPSQLFGKTIFGGILIYLTPMLVFKVIIPLNNALVNYISTWGIGFQKFQSLIDINNSLNGGYMVITALIFAICCVILLIYNGIRYAEIIFNVIMGPVLATSLATNNGEGYQLWWRETLSVVLAQPAQYVILNLFFNALMSDGFLSYLSAIGALILMMRGPALIRQFLYSSGTSNTVVGAAGSAGRMAAMRMMFSSIR